MTITQLWTIDALGWPAKVIWFGDAGNMSPTHDKINNIVTNLTIQLTNTGGEYSAPLNGLGHWEQRVVNRDAHFVVTDGIEVVITTMMTSSNGNIFRVTGPLCGEFTGPGKFPAQRPVTQSFDVSLICARINDWVNNREAGDLRRHHGHYDVNLMTTSGAASDEKVGIGNFRFSMVSCV